MFVNIKVVLTTLYQRDGIAKPTYYNLRAQAYYIVHLIELGDETDRNIEPNLIIVP